MSLINNMLKDLEKRKTQSLSPPNIALTQPITFTSNFSKNKKLILCGLFLSLMIIGIFFKNFHRKPPLVSMLKNNSTFKTPFFLSKENSTWNQPVAITGVTVQVKENITELSFLLNHTALYRITNNGMPNQLTLTIDHSELLSELPAINYMNTAIQRIMPQKINDEVKFNIYLYPGTTIKYVNLTNDDRNPELVLAIEYLPTTASQQQDSNAKSIVMHNGLTQQYQQALKAIKNNEFYNASTQLKYILKINPNFNDARVTLSALLIDKKNLFQAKQIINEGLRLNPDYLPFIELKARIFITEDKFHEALKLLQDLTPPIEENLDFYTLIAAIYEHTNNNALATKIYKQLLTINPHNSHWWLGLGVVLENQGHIKSAINAYARALTEGHLNNPSYERIQQHLQRLKEVGDEKS